MEGFQNTAYMLFVCTAVLQSELSNLNFFFLSIVVSFSVCRLLTTSLTFLLAIHWKVIPLVRQLRLLLLMLSEKL